MVEDECDFCIKEGLVEHLFREFHKFRKYRAPYNMVTAALFSEFLERCERLFNELTTVRHKSTMFLLLMAIFTSNIFESWMAESVFLAGTVHVKTLLFETLARKLDAELHCSYHTSLLREATVASLKNFKFS
jgi:predicted nucleic acid-binding protein